jgi:hypothetical protein
VRLNVVVMSWLRLWKFLSPDICCHAAPLIFTRVSEKSVTYFYLIENRGNAFLEQVSKHFSKTLGATSKLYVQEGRHKARSMLRNPKYYAPQLKNRLPGDLSPKICAHLQLHVSSKPHSSTSQKVVIFSSPLLISACL